MNGRTLPYAKGNWREAENKRNGVQLPVAGPPRGGVTVKKPILILRVMIRGKKVRTSVLLWTKAQGEKDIGGVWTREPKRQLGMRSKKNGGHMGTVTLY